jgi:signal transduction histidine kinase
MQYLLKSKQFRSKKHQFSANFEIYSANCLRKFANQIIRAQEDERRRVSRELHDEAGQALTLLKVSLELILSDLNENQVDLKITNQVVEALRLCEGTMTTIRMLAHNLRPGALDDLGLNLTLDGLCHDFIDRTHLAISYDGDEVPVVDDAIQICLFRFLQEGLTNVVKHAQATKVRVRLAYSGDFIHLVIVDNGTGFIRTSEFTAPGTTQGIGLLGLKERLAEVQGRLVLTSEPGKGTCLTAIVPYSLAS